MAIATNDRLITTAEAARIAGVDETTVQWWARTGKVPFTRTSRAPRAHFRFRESQIQALARQRRRA
jgi:excisionase family DNA binding protein